TGVALTPPS
nr:Chain C, PopB [Pseudomonas aeruginosa CHA]4JL0_D Chain D, PopB [Pseudomonas aeruginosa CHA]